MCNHADRFISCMVRHYDVTYHEPSEDIDNVDLIMYWESPCTVNGPNAPQWNKVVRNPIKNLVI